MLQFININRMCHVLLTLHRNLLTPQYKNLNCKSAATNCALLANTINCKRGVLKYTSNKLSVNPVDMTKTIVLLHCKLWRRGGEEDLFIPTRE
jgi:hypothetical protein